MSDAPVTKAKKPAAPAQHPKYNEMIKAAVGALKERTGSSRQAITKYIKANYKVTEVCEPHIKMALKRMVNKAELVQTKGTGASGSFKLNKAAKEPAEKKKKPAAKKPAAKKVAKKPAKKSTPKKEAKKIAKKAAAKKASPKKAAAKKASPKKATKPKKAAAKKPAKKPAAKKAGKKPAAKKAVKKSAKK